MEQSYNNNINKCVSGTSDRLNISFNNTRQMIEVTNNRAQYYAELASQYKEDARKLMELAKYYAEQNSDVTMSNLKDLEAKLLAQITLKQDIGDYVLSSTLSAEIDNLTNSPDYVNKTVLENALDKIKLPEQSGNADKLLTTDGEQTYWTNMVYDHIPIFSGMYFDHIPNNSSWVIAGGQVVFGDIYEFAYNELVNELTNPKYGLNVIETSAMLIDEDYSDYWKINQTEQYFICPTKISYSPISGDNLTVSAKANLYFKLANAVKDIELLNAGRVLETVTSIIPENSSLISSFSMPSDKYIDLTLGASHSVYIAPADGWYSVTKESTAAHQNMTLESGGLRTTSVATGSGGWCSVFIPVKRGDEVQVTYNVGGATIYNRFTYAEGSKED